MRRPPPDNQEERVACSQAPALPAEIAGFARSGVFQNDAYIGVWLGAEVGAPSQGPWQPGPGWGVSGNELGEGGAPSPR